MQAIILAAGLGNRMRPLTDPMPKGLLTIDGGTIIDRIVSGLYDDGIHRIAVVTGYKAQALREHLLAAHPQVDFTFVHNERYRETNNICSLSLALNTLDIVEDVILVESDVIYESGTIRQLMDSPYPNVALVDRFRGGMDGTVVTVDRGVVTSVIPPQLQNVDFDFSDKYKTLNIYKFSREFCATSFKTLLDFYARIIDDTSYYELILGILIYVRKEIIHAEIIGGSKWAEVDDPNDLREAEFVFDQEGRLEILERSHGGFWNHDVLDFCYPRNVHFPNSSMVSELRYHLPRLLETYGSSQEILNEKLSYFLLCRPENVHLLNGASQIYPILGRTFASARALRPDPTFGEYQRLFPQASLYGDEVGVNVEEIVSKAEDVDIVIFVNPNNPTGTTLSSEWIHAFARNRPGQAVLVDESFIDFSGEVPLLTLLEERPLANVILVKSLGKCLGVPGLRLGFVHSTSPAFHRQVSESLPIWNCNSLAECFLEILLKHRPSLAESFEQVRRDRAELACALTRLEFVRRVHPSGGSFLLVEFTPEAGDMRDLARRLLARHRIYVKDVSSRFPGGRSFLRLAVRTASDHRRLLEKLSESCSHRGKASPPPGGAG